MIHCPYRFETVRRWFKLVIIIVPILFLAGCLEYDELIFVNADGSGNMSIHYQAEKDMKFENLYFPTDFLEVKENIKRNYVIDGLRAVNHDVRYKEKKTHVYMNFEFDQLAALNKAPRFQNERFESLNNGKKVTLKRFLHLDEDKLDRTKLLLKSGLRSLFSRNVLSEIKFRFQWIVPGPITDTNATVLGDRNRAIWNITLEEILKTRSVEFYLEYTVN